MADAPVSRDAVYRVARVFDRSKLLYAYMGGVALNVWGIPRATFDLDLTLSVGDAELTPLLVSLEAEGFVVDPPFLRGHRDSIGGMPKFHFQLPVGATLLTVDVFLSRTDFLRSVLSRRVGIDLGSGRVFVVTAADLLLFKVLAGRRKDVLDIENILMVQGVPERPYLEQWGRVLGIEDRLAAAIQRR